MPAETDLSQWKACPKCGTGLDALLVGGVGSWRNAILCTRCFATQRGLNFERVIVPLVALKYGISWEAAHQADQRSEEEFQAVCLGSPPFDDLPGVPVTARWKARRLHAAGEL